MAKKKKLKKSKIRKKRESKISNEQPTKTNYYKSKNYKTNEIKIKKILKQPTEKKIYNVKDYVVYPKHGVGKIVSIDKAKIGSIEINFWVTSISKNILIWRVFTNKAPLFWIVRITILINP